MRGSLSIVIGNLWERRSRSALEGGVLFYFSTLFFVFGNDGRMGRIFEMDQRRVARRNKGKGHRCALYGVHVSATLFTSEEHNSDKKGYENIKYIYSIVAAPCIFQFGTPRSRVLKTEGKLGIFL